MSPRALSRLGRARLVAAERPTRAPSRVVDGVLAPAASTKLQRPQVVSSQPVDQSAKPSPSAEPPPSKPSPPTLQLEPSSPGFVIQPSSSGSTPGATAPPHLLPLSRPPRRVLSKASALFSRPPPSFAYSSPTFRLLYQNDAAPEICLVGRSNVGKSSLVNALLAGAGIVRRTDGFAPPGGKPSKQERRQRAKKSDAALARTSARPGLTRTMNAYCVGPPPAARRRPRGAPPRNPKHKLTPPCTLVLVDTPGYGHASRGEWGAEMDKYLSRRAALRGALLLVDAGVVAQAAVRMMALAPAEEEEEGGWGTTAAGRKRARLRLEEALPSHDRAALAILRAKGVPTAVVLTKGDRLMPAIKKATRKHGSYAVEEEDEDEEEAGWGEDERGSDAGDELAKSPSSPLAMQPVEAVARAVWAALAGAERDGRRADAEESARGGAWDQPPQQQAAPPPRRPWTVQDRVWITAAAAGKTDGTRKPKGKVAKEGRREWKDAGIEALRVGICEMAGVDLMGTHEKEEEEWKVVDRRRGRRDGRDGRRAVQEDDDWDEDEDDEDDGEWDELEREDAEESEEYQGGRALDMEAVVGRGVGKKKSPYVEKPLSGMQALDAAVKKQVHGARRGRGRDAEATF